MVLLLDIVGRIKKINAGGVTTFNEFAVVSENRVVACDDAIPGSLAWLLGCALPTGAGMVLNAANPGPEQEVGVFGLGGVGLSALIGARVARVRNIFAVDIDDAKLAIAEDLGANHLVNSTRTDPLAYIREHTSGLGLDYTFEASGRTEVTEVAFAAVKRNGGRCLFASHPKAGSKIKIDPFELICGKSIEGSWGGDTKPDRDFRRYADYYSQGRLPLQKLGVREYSLDRVNEAMNDLKYGRVSRAYLKIH